MISGFDDIDREAMREGSAISRLRAYSPTKKRKEIVKKGNKKKGKKEKEIDILEALNILHGEKDVFTRPTIKALQQTETR